LCNDKPHCKALALLLPAKSTAAVRDLGRSLCTRRRIPAARRGARREPTVLAHRYALSLDIDTLVLGVKNRRELAECVAAAEAGPLAPELIARIDRSIADAGDA
jgi:hypothetical protein